LERDEKQLFFIKKQLERASFQSECSRFRLGSGPFPLDGGTGCLKPIRFHSELRVFRFF